MIIVTEPEVLFVFVTFSIHKIKFNKKESIFNVTKE